MNIGYYLSLNSRRIGEKPAIYCDQKMYTYKELNDEVNSLANGLLQLGISKGEKVALLMKNSDQFVIAFYAAAKIGAVIVPINFRLVASEVHYILGQSDSSAVIYDEEFREIAKEASVGIDSVRYLIVNGWESEGERSITSLLSGQLKEPKVTVTWEDDLEILYTSGTTGRPKGALFDHRRILNVNMAIAVGLRMHAEDRLLHLAPLFHSAQLNLFLITGIYLGATHVIHREFEPVTTLEAIEKHRITLFFGVPAMYNFLLQVPKNYELSSVERCAYGAAPMAPELIRKSMEMFQTDKFYNLCGLTEAGPGGILLLPHEHQTKMGSGGKAFALTEARVINELMEDAPDHAVGELVLRGETIMKEYYKKPDETKKALQGGWLHTGDLATRDEDGYITLVDRKKDMIISGGENVYSIEVEQVLYEHPAVLEAAAIGVPDETWGEMVAAVVVLKQGEQVMEDELQSFCRKHLAGYKIPRVFFFTEALPRNASGKVLKYHLRDKFSQKTIM
ncbi:feruloyl-CoA synthase [Bacillus ectoiniformans]|uniref:class I adenylate-forming enzyme family protein n=1 Tax=Bacillus ectoiniformans TaxID=1494429 RepID=UPI00195AE2D4|nr:long-chain-fatty-acid--CoA ligase [Bacillus ectoiniformans]MBM7647718.1 feruloyl-CoA synthase [Bacillus ectoiniformans]